MEFCGEWHEVDADRPFGIGRDADLVVDDNPFLHRRLLEIEFANGLWVLSNVGSRLAVTVSDGAGRMQSWLAPGGRLPLVFEHTVVVFSAGQTTYELNDPPRRAGLRRGRRAGADGQTTIGVMAFTESQKLLMLALAEPMLLRDGSGMSDIPTSARAAERLGWALTRFNRKLDNVCDKLDRAGVKGLRGGRRPRHEPARPAGRVRHRGPAGHAGRSAAARSAGGDLMRLKVTLRRPAGEVDLSITADATASVADIARHLAAADPSTTGPVPVRTCRCG